MIHIFKKVKKPLVVVTVSVIAIAIGLVAYVYTKGDDVPEGLSANDWVWLQTEFSDGSIISPPEGEEFTLSFNGEGTLSSTTDCNNLFAEFKIYGDKIKVKNMAMTEMFCGEETQERVFSEQLGASETYLISGGRLLELKLKNEDGSMFFWAKEE